MHWLILENTSWLEARGPHAERFLQAQLTCDVSAIGIGDHAFGAWLTPKGRIVVLFDIYRAEADCFLLGHPHELSEQVSKRLTLFVMRAKVKIKSRDDLATIGVLANDIGPLETAIDDSHALVIRSGGRPRTFVLAPTAILPSLEKRLRALDAPVPYDAWLLNEVREAIPFIGIHTTEAFVPQAAGLDELGALSFEKGCYPGQEIVARTRYLGKMKRRLEHHVLPGTHLPDPGAKVSFLAADGAVSSAGQVVVAAPSGDEVEVLAVMSFDPEQTESTGRGTLSYREPHGLVLEAPAA